MEPSTQNFVSSKRNMPEPETIQACGCSVLFHLHRGLCDPLAELI
jgi:hypothetical protein